MLSLQYRWIFVYFRVTQPGKSTSEFFGELPAGYNSRVRSFAVLDIPLQPPVLFFRDYLIMTCCKIDGGMQARSGQQVLRG